MNASAGFSLLDRQRARRGVVLSIIGGAVMAAAKASGFFLRAIFGGEMWGLYAIAWSFTELLAFFLVGGFADAAVVFSSRTLHAQGDQDEHYAALSKIIALPFLFALLVAGVLHLFAPFLHQTFWSAHDPILVDLVRILAWALPLLVLVQVPVEATRAALRFGPAVGIVQIVLPILSLLGAVGCYYWFDASILAVGKGALLALCVCAPLSLWVYSRQFGLKRTLRGLLSPRAGREALSFAIPQSLNMMVNQGLNRMDSLMLSAFGVSANAIGVYSLVSELTQLIRVAKLAFSGVYSPLVAKYRAQANPSGIIQALEDTAGKTSLLGLALLMVTMSIWPDVIFDRGEVWHDSILFPWLLCVGPLMSAFFGLCGNTLLMLGHSRLLLKNALLSGLVNLVLNALLIPVWGLFGAALATAVASITISTLQMVELRKYENVGVKLRVYERNLLAALPGILGALVVSLWLAPATGHTLGLLSPFLTRLACAVLSLGSYAALLWALPGHFPFAAAPHEVR